MKNIKIKIPLTPSERVKRYKLKYPDRVRKSYKKWRKKNPNYHNIFMKNWRIKHPERFKETVKKQTQKRQNWLNEIKTNRCHDCKKKFNFWQMQFDHVPEFGEKLKEITSSLMGNWKKFFFELFKCELVCSNCHSNRTYFRRQERKKWKRQQNQKN